MLVARASAAEKCIDFNRDVRPILSDTCYACHGPDDKARTSELRLDREESARAEHDGRRAIVAGDLERSELYRRITSADPDERMPPPDSGRQLTAAQIDVLRRWIAEGAKWDQHWSFAPPRRPELPAVRRADWPRNAIDHFILARLEREGIEPSPEAPKETLIRRVTLDLTGLPPTPAEVDAFLADASPQAYEKLGDRLLESPHYGEHMAWHWLDAARYADTNGYQQDRTRTMWPWRDWVVRALNDNMPFDQFTIEQIAGDLLPEPTVDQRIATGFNRNHPLNGEGGRIAEESRVEYVIDRVDTTATVWLGLTAGCARCHNHKYDPLTQKEFYSLYAFFNNIDESGSVDRGGNAAPVMKVPDAAQRRHADELHAQIAQLEARLQTSAAPDPATPDPAVQMDLEQARKTLAELEKSFPETMVMAERSQPREAHVLIRGQYDQYGEAVTPGVPAWLSPLPEGAPNNRLGLAQWLVDPANPLTARVTVNRHWQLFFGTGLVKTTEDFGSQGERPTHPLLLDWLATELVRTGWDIKALHKLIVTSATYRQSSKLRPELLERDAANRLLARSPRYRLPSHVVRDQALALGGLLSGKMGGPGVNPYQPAGIWEEFSFGKIKFQQSSGEELYRRSLYVFWRRSVGPTTLFDTSDRQVCLVRPRRTNTPLQSLILLNDPAYVEAARAFGQRMILEGGQTPEQRIAWAFRLATARRPSQDEARLLVEGFRRVLERYRSDVPAAEALLAVGQSPRDAALDPAEHAAYAGVASVLLNLDEAINRE